MRFFHNEDENSYAFQWIVEICEPEKESKVEKDYKFEDFQIGEVVRVKSFEECMKFENVDGYDFRRDNCLREKCCGQTFTIENVFLPKESFVAEENVYSWHYKWLEKVE